MVVITDSDVALCPDKSELVAAESSYDQNIADMLKVGTPASGRLTVNGHSVRCDETGSLLSIKDIVQAIEGCNPAAAQKKVDKLTTECHITEGANTEFKRFKNVTYMVLGAPINAIGRLCAHLKGDLARQINKLFVDSGTAFIRANPEDVAQMQRNAALMDLGVKENSAIANVFRRATVRPYMDTRVRRTAVDKVNRGNNSGIILHNAYSHDDNNEVGDAMKILSKVLNVALRHTNEMNDMKEICDSVKSNTKYKFLLDAAFPVTFYEHANQCVYGFTCSTRKFKADNGLPKTTQLCYFMNKGQLNLVIQFVQSFLNQLENDHAAGKKITQAHVKSVSQKMRNKIFEISRLTRLDVLVKDEMEKALDVTRQENKNLATLNRLGKSEQIHQQMSTETAAEKKRKSERTDAMKERLLKTARTFAS